VDVHEITIVSEEMGASPELTAIGLSVFEANVTVRGLPDVRDHQSAAEGMALDEPYQVARTRWRGLLDDPGVALLMVSHAPAVLMGT
jgi:hypothetical protein